MAASIAVARLVRGTTAFHIWTDPCAAEQELATAALHWCELVVALRVLARGGTLVLKLFTLFEHVTVSALWLARGCFERLVVCKPVASKAVSATCHHTSAPLTNRMRCREIPRYFKALPRSGPH